MQLNTEFKFNLGQKVIPGMVAAGKFSAGGTYLVAALAGGKVMVTNLWSAASNAGVQENSNNVLNINQSILSLKTGKFNKRSEEKDFVFIGTNSSLLVYDAENNADVFYKEVTDGVSCCEIGSLGNFDDNVVVVGGHCSLAAFDYKGEEVLWSVTGDNVTSLAMVDITNRGIRDLLVGSEDFEIRVFRDDDIINEITETETVTSLCSMGGAMFGYGLANGTVGVYERLCRLWRIKSKAIPTTMVAFDMNGDGAMELVTGWSNGKIDIRRFDTGEVLFKDNLKSPISGLVKVPHPQYSTDLLLVCSNEGIVRIYKSLPSSGGGVDTAAIASQDILYELTLNKQNLLMELKNFGGEKQGCERAAVQTIPTDTRVDLKLRLSDSPDKGVELCFQTNNDVLIRAVMIFAEGIFDGECHVAHPSTQKLSSSLVVHIAPPKDIAVDLHMKVIVGYKTDTQFHVFDIIRSLPRFCMYSMLSMNHIFTRPSGFVQFSVTERLKRFVLWINQNFLLEKELDLESKDQAELNLKFLSLRDNNCLELQINSKTNHITVATDHMDIAGNIVTSLCEYLNLEHLSSVCNFPKEFDSLNDVISKISGIQTSRQRMTCDIADSSNIIKNFIVRAEDYRIMQQMSGMRKCYRELMNLNRDLVGRFKIRSINHQELISQLKFVNAFIQKGANLRVGKYRTSLVGLCRQAVKDNHLQVLEKLVKTGVE